MFCVSAGSQKDVCKETGSLFDRADESRDIIRAEAVYIPKAALTANQNAVAEVVRGPDRFHRPPLLVAEAADLPFSCLDRPLMGVGGVIPGHVGRVVAQLMIRPVHALSYRKLRGANEAVCLGKQIRIAVVIPADRASDYFRSGFRKLEIADARSVRRSALSASVQGFGMEMEPSPMAGIHSNTISSPVSD